MWLGKRLRFHVSNQKKKSAVIAYFKFSVNQVSSCQQVEVGWKSAILLCKVAALFSLKL